MFLILITAFLFVYVVQREEDVLVSNTLSSQGQQSDVSQAPLSSVAISEPPIISEPTQSSEQLDDWQLVLVNSTHKMPENFEQNIVVELGFEMDERIVQPYRDMYNAAVEEGVYLWISSAYRDYETQERLFENEVEQNKKSGMTQEQAEIEAEKAVQRPGYSEHSTGLVLDFNGVTEDFQHDSAYIWLQEHAAEYGFILRYPEGKEEITGIMFEPWHYRYVGVEHAQKMKELGYCLEEYVDYLKEALTEVTESSQIS